MPRVKAKAGAHSPRRAVIISAIAARHAGAIPARTPTPSDTISSCAASHHDGDREIVTSSVTTVIFASH
jgi:hypothetical protein